jgi:hypothetical protein
MLVTGRLYPEWKDLVTECRATVAGMGEWPKDRGIGPVCPMHGARHMKRVAHYTYRCSMEPDTSRDYFLYLGSQGIEMRPTSRIAGVNP